MLYLHRISCSVNIRNRSLHPLIDNNASLDTQLQTGFLCQCSVRYNANGKNHHIRTKRTLPFQQNIDAAALLLKALYRVSERQLDAMSAHFIMNKRSHIRIKRIHQLLWTLDDSYLHTQLTKIFSQLQSDKAAARQHNGPWMILIDILLDT